MDEQTDFRALLLKIQDSLSEDDRLRFHFLMGDIIPRHIRDNSTLGGTLHILELLFNQGKIDPQDFRFLIHAFHQIGCHTAVKRLKEHQQSRHFQESSENLLEQLIDDVEDKTLHINTQKLIVTEDPPPLPPDDTAKELDKVRNEEVQIIRKPPTRSPSRRCQMSLFLINLISITIFAMIVINVQKSEIPYKELMRTLFDPYVGEQTERHPFDEVKLHLTPFNDTFDLQSELAVQNMKAHQKPFIRSYLKLYQVSFLLMNLFSIIICIIIVINVRKSNISSGDVMLTLIGPYHGEPTGGQPFNDAKDCLLTFNDQITAVIGGGTKSEISYLSFIYSNGKSMTRGIMPKHAEQYKFKLRSDEYIDHVTVYTGTRLIVNFYKPTGTFLVVGLRFHTNQGRFSELFGSDDGEEKKEFYKGYHLGYVRGQAQGCIDALQFIWYKEAARTDTAILLRY